MNERMEGNRDLLVIVPSRGRPENVDRLIRAWKDTRGFHHSDLLLVVDADDPYADGYRDVAAESAAWPIELRWVPRWRPMVHKLDAAAVASADRYAAVGFMGDDHLPRTVGWAQRYTDELRSLGTGVVYGNDLHRGEDLATQWAMTSDIIRALGRMVPAPVQHQFCDRAVMAMGRELGALRYLSDVVIEHMHYLAGKSQKDATYKRANHRALFKSDRAAYHAWIADGLANDAQKLRELRVK